MGWKIFVFTVLCTVVAPSYQAYFDTCHPDIYLQAGETKTLVSPGYPLTGFPIPSSCRYRIITSSEYQVKAVCSIVLVPSPDNKCTYQRWLVNENGDTNMNSATYYCGTQTVTSTSINNALTLAYFNDKFSGHFTCTLQSVCDCGNSVSSRIVNGTNASPTEFPAMASLFNPGPQRHFCGATIVSSQWVVTAAHCLPLAQKNFQVAAGIYNTKSPTVYKQFLTVERNVTHPSYTKNSDAFDIAMVKIWDYFQWSPAVARVCLPFFYPSYDFSNRVVQATGWGTSELGGKTSDILQKVSLNVLTNFNCNRMLTSAKVDGSQICTYSQGRDTCQYDSGGPIWYRAPNDYRLFHVGLVSYGESCGGPTPGVNTRTTSFMNWIELNTGPLCKRAIV